MGNLCFYQCRGSLKGKFIIRSYTTVGVVAYIIQASSIRSIVVYNVDIKLKKKNMTPKMIEVRQATQVVKNKYSLYGTMIRNAILFVISSCAIK